MLNKKTRVTLSNKFFLNDKKALGPIVATALLFVVATVAVVGFQNWFGSFSSSTFVGVEQKSETGDTQIEALIGENLYFKNGFNDNITIKSVKIGGFDCNVSGTYSTGMPALNISACRNNLTVGISEVVVYTTKGIYSEKIYLNEAIISLESVCLSLTLEIDDDGDGFYNSSQVIYPTPCPDYQGLVDSNDLNSTINPDSNCLFKANKSGCTSNLIVDGCGSGTVLDKSTSLCWQRDFNAAGTRTWSDAQTYCSGLTTGGQTDWYLPTKKELFTIVDFSRSSPATIDGNTKFQNVASTYYFTDTTFRTITSFAWLIHMGTGQDVGGYAKTSPYRVVCVRRE
ncbi:MAG: DUF1566 domain-containing protein [Nanoarchaeota archaeon]|nr:DUF1566 domain-containing protein [Nanoarchaeota archaeon]